VIWPGAAPRRLSAALLRAHSRASGAIRARLEGCAVAAPADLRILALALVGSYAVNIAFSDGHDRGIYPWAWLRAIALGAESSSEGKELLPSPSAADQSAANTGPDGPPSERRDFHG